MNRIGMQPAPQGGTFPDLGMARPCVAAHARDPGHPARRVLLRRVLWAGLAALLAGGTAAASPPDPALEQRLHQEVQDLLLRLVESGAAQPEQLASLTVSADPSQRVSFGAVIDVGANHDAAGIPVLAVTPGGNAARLGLRAGDRIIAVDGERVHGSDGATVLQHRLAEGEPQLQLRVLRDGAEHDLRGPVQAHALPGYRLELGAALAHASVAATAGDAGCGRISVVGAPPRTQDVFPATLVFIDGETPKPWNSPSYRLPAGRHVLTVSERIDRARFGLDALRDFQRRQLDREGYKQLELVVEPGTTYRLGARLLTERSDEILSNGYWEPVIYAEVAEGCR